MSLSSRLVASVVAGTLALGSAPGFADPKHDKGSKHAANQGGGHHLQGPGIDVGQIRIILGDNRNLIGSASSLPPGIQKNLARGKPLPPGLAKRLDGRLLDRLPHYDGYEWKQVGTNLVLVALATGIVYEMLDRVLE